MLTFAFDNLRNVFIVLKMNISEALQSVQQELPPTTQLVAVSKTHPVEAVREAYDAGQRIFGENKAQELRDKSNLLPKDIEWQFIGHLQTNKIKYIIHSVALIHSVDSLRLLIEINREAKKAGRIVNCLLQFYIAREETKFGLDLSEAKQLLSSPEYQTLQHINIVGVMGMASFTDDSDVVRKEFRSLKVIFDELKACCFPAKDDFKEISMGMSNDYSIAVEEGSTLVRVGSRIFGQRNYSN